MVVSELYGGRKGYPGSVEHGYLMCALCVHIYFFRRFFRIFGVFWDWECGVRNSHTHSARVILMVCEYFSELLKTPENAPRLLKPCETLVCVCKSSYTMRDKSTHSMAVVQSTGLQQAISGIF